MLGSSPDGPARAPDTCRVAVFRYTAAVMRLGSLQLHLVSDGEFRLDGGAMFGVVPKVLWERHKPADERNRIRMTANCLLVEAATTCC